MSKIQALSEPGACRSAMANGLSVNAQLQFDSSPERNKASALRDSNFLKIKFGGQKERA
jgi:hypothetical protein